MTPDRNLLSGLSSLDRMSKRDQQALNVRLYLASHEAKRAGAIPLAANLLRASYELEKIT